MIPSATDNFVDERAVILEVEPPPAEANPSKFTFVIAFLLKCIDHIVNLLEPTTRVWINYYARTFGEEVVIMPQCSFSFLIISLYAFAEVKSQGAEFPFRTHPRSINAAVNSLLIYGLASAAEHVISVTCLGPASVYAITARLGRISCLCILVVSLACLFYL